MRFRTMRGALQEASRGLRPLVGEHLDVGEAGGVVDADVAELPTSLLLEALLRRSARVRWRLPVTAMAPGR